jgi:thiol-disulfide isomerase/thioredoxin/tetratricopeptide (TPR) repeat protein
MEHEPFRSLRSVAVVLTVVWSLCLPLLTRAQERASPAAPGSDQALDPATDCQASPEVSQALKGLPAGAAERRAALKTLLERYPEDLFVHGRYQVELRLASFGSVDALLTEYRALLAKHSDEPVYQYLAAAALIGTDTKEALALLDQVLARSPGFASAHLRKAEVHSAPNFRDPDRVREHLKAFLELCPTSIQGYVHLRQLGPAEADFVAEGTRRLRALLQDRTDPESIRAYQTLWALEFRTRPPADHPELRKQVAEDLKRLRALDPERYKEIAPVFVEGYKLTEDAESRKWAEDLIGRPAVDNVMTAYRQWTEKNPFPQSGDLPEKARERNAALLKVTEEWVRQWPDDPAAWQQRLSAMRAVSAVSPEEVEAAGDALLRLRARRGPDGPGSVASQGPSSSGVVAAATSYQWPPLALPVADIFMTRGVRLDRVPELLDLAAQDLAVARPAIPRSDLYPYPGPSGPGAMDYHAWQQVADLALRVGEREKARLALDRMHALIEQQKSVAKETTAGDSSLSTRLDGWLAAYFERAGRLAEMEDRKQDALAAYEQQLRFRPRPSYVHHLINDPSTERARMLWYESGGSYDGWLAWLDRVEAAASRPRVAEVSAFGWATVERKLPAFDLADLHGQKWTLADLRGKVTLINLWATWCGPCVEELPGLQMLYERLKGRSDVSILSLNIDEDPGLVEPFLKERKLSFPVIPAKPYVAGIDPSFSIPRNWLVSPDGVVRREQVGYSAGGGERWVDQMTEAIEKAR